MLKHLPPEGLDSLLALYNKIWQQGFLREKSLESTIIPTSKPGEDSSNYRSIAPTSVLCNWTERKVNVRLLDFFDRKGTLSTLQSGGRAKWTTTDHLLSLEATVRNVKANSEQVASIFFDTEKSYILIWRQGVQMDLKEAGIEGIMLNIIRNFIKPRSFKVKVNEILTHTNIQTQGIAQGSVGSPTFFILKINKVLVHLPNDNRFQNHFL